MAGTHRIIDEADGFFKLEPATPDAAIPPEIIGIVEAIQAELGRLKDRAGNVGMERLKQLRAVAAQGLTGNDPDVAGARAELRSKFRYPNVYPEGTDEIAVEVPRGATKEQLDFVFRFNESARIVRKLHQPRQLGARFFWRWLRALPGHLLSRLAPDRQTRPMPQAEAAPAPTEAFQKARFKLIRAARFALPDIGDDRPPDISLADRLVEVVVQEARLDLGPAVRRNHLTDLAAAYAGTALIFAIACFVLYLFWGFIYGWHALRDNPGEPAYKNFSLAAVAVAFLFVGAWLSTAQRLNSTDKSALESVFAENFDSWMRACVLLGVGVLIILLLHKEVVVINLGGTDGDLSTKNVLDSFSAAVIVGALLGLSERVLPDVLTERSKGLVDRLGPAKEAAPPPQAPNAGPPARPAAQPPVPAPAGPGTPAEATAPEATPPVRPKGKG